MANAATPIIPRDGTLTVADGAALTLAIAYHNGDLKMSGLNAYQDEHEFFMSRGEIYGGRRSQKKVVDFTFTADLVHLLGDATTATLFEAIMRKGVWAAATSTWPAAAGDAYTLKFTWAVERTNFGGAGDNTVVAKYVQCDIDIEEGVPSKISVKGRIIPHSSDYLTWT